MTLSALGSTIHFVMFIFMGSFDKYIKWKLQIFDPIACVTSAPDYCQWLKTGRATPMEKKI